MISTQDLSELPDIDTLKARMQSLAVVDAILDGEPYMREWSFNAHWGEGQAMGARQNGAGDELFAVFYPFGAIIKGFAHEAPMTPYRKVPPQIWEGVVDSVPKAFTDFLNEPAFSPTDTTFCVWRTLSDTTWQRGAIEFANDSDPDGSEDLMHLLDGNPETYQNWIGWSEDEEGLEALAAIYQHAPITRELVAALNAKCDFDSLQAELEEIGYSSPA